MTGTINDLSLIFNASSVALNLVMLDFIGRPFEEDEDE
jgi:hypothetical protein